jgi:manganese-dependent ADP-ribose/CDP-alcohol diphosphatase
MTGSTPLFRFGVISDVQWADIPDGHSFHGTPRYYREALVSARRALSAFKAARVDLAIHLGDIVDWHNAQQGGSEAALDAVVSSFDDLGVPVLHCIGNHCLYNAPRPRLNAILGINNFKTNIETTRTTESTPHQNYYAGQHSYFAWRLLPGFRFVVLDGYDVSILGWPAGHPLHEKAVKILEENNPNEEKNSNKGLEGTKKRFVKFGGGVSDAQLAWLRSELIDARAAGDRVIVCSHLCLHPGTCPATCLLWNYEQVLTILAANADVVVATLAGHAHKDGYIRDAAGIHHRVCQAVLETPPGRDCFGVLSVFPDRIEVEGYGDFASDVWGTTTSSGQENNKGTEVVSISTPVIKVDATSQLNA